MASWKDSSGGVYEDNPFSDMKDTSISPKTALMQSSHGNSAGPAWLMDSTPKPNQGNTNNSLQQEQKTLHPEVPRMIFLTRVTNLGLSVCMIVVSLLSLLTTNTATTGVLACYVIVFSCLLCCFETHLTQISKFIALNFGFMYSAKSRVAFMVFLGTILFSFSLFGKIVGLLMLVNAGFNMYILFKHPEFDAAQRSDATNDIKDYLAANPAFAQQFISLGVQTAAENPNVAKQVMGSFFSSSATQPTSRNSQEFTSV